MISGTRVFTSSVPTPDTEHAPRVRECYRLAADAVANGNHPFGALLVLDGRVVARAMNDAVTSHDPTRHAELLLLQHALPTLDASERPRAVLYTSTEPCAMCSGAIYWAGIATVVFGCSARALADVAGDDFLVPCAAIFALGARPVTVVGPVLEPEGRAQHQAYWPRPTPPGPVHG